MLIPSATPAQDVQTPASCVNKTGGVADWIGVDMHDRTRSVTFPEPTTTTRPQGASDPRPDGCPECLVRGNEPHTVSWTLDGSGYYATYRCGACRHQWWTGWSTEPVEVPHG